MDREAGEACESLTSEPSGASLSSRSHESCDRTSRAPRYASAPGAQRFITLLNRQHAVERNFRPVFALVRDDDAVSDLAFDEPFERPQQMIGRDAEHRGAEATELIEREYRAVGVHLVSEAIDEVDFRAHRPDRSDRTRGDRLDDVFGRSGIVCRLNHFPWHLRMDDYAHSGVLRAQVLNLTDRETRVHRAVALPQNDPRPPHGVWLEPAPDLVRIPYHHLVERHPKLVRGIAAKMLIGQEQNALAALPCPPQRRRGIRRRADDAAALATKRFDRCRGVDVSHRDEAADVHLFQIAPAHLELFRFGHVGHRAARGEIGEDHPLIWRAQDIGAFGHEMHAAEDDEFGVRMSRDLTSELE